MRGEAFDEAFARIEPKNEAERERLAQLKESIRASSAGMADEMAKFEAEQAGRKRETEEATRRVRERGAIAEAAREALLESLETQADVVGRIVTALRRRAGSE